MKSNSLRLSIATSAIIFAIGNSPAYSQAYPPPPPPPKPDIIPEPQPPPGCFIVGGNVYCYDLPIEGG